MSKKNQYLAPHPDGWAVATEGSQRVASVYQTQHEAIEAGGQGAINNRFVHVRIRQIRERKR